MTITSKLTVVCPEAPVVFLPLSVNTSWLYPFIHETTHISARLPCNLTYAHVQSCHPLDIHAASNTGKYLSRKKLKLLGLLMCEELMVEYRQLMHDRVGHQCMHISRQLHAMCCWPQLQYTIN